ncbi:MAG TPA: hypothetical protein VF016_02055 [Nitrososphaera sp.]|nr:hypothetical protein [uncultured Nitrososphaera sp.]
MDNSPAISMGDVDATDLLFSASMLTTILFLSSLAVFALVAIKTKSIKNFQSQIAVFAGVYALGEVLELHGMPMFANLPAEIGPQLHVAATVILSTILWVRLFSAGKIVKKLVDNNGNGDIHPAGQ